MSLFDRQEQANLSSNAPLAEKARPELPDQLLGQERIWSEGTMLWNLVMSKKFQALLFWGPPTPGGPQNRSG